MLNVKTENTQMNKDQLNEMINYANELKLDFKWSIKGDGYNLTINNKSLNTYKECETYLDSIQNS